MSYGRGYGRRRRSGGLKIRLLIAAVMIGFSLFSYYSTGQVNPITGEKQRVTLSPDCLLYTSPSPRDLSTSRMPSSA